LPVVVTTPVAVTVPVLAISKSVVHVIDGFAAAHVRKRKSPFASRPNANDALAVLTCVHPEPFQRAFCAI
jgi:hypothetical protein